MKKLKTLDPTAPSFECNGKIYYIESNLSIARFCEYQIMEKEAGFGTTFKAIFDELHSLYDLMNNTKFVEASIKLHNLVTGVSRLQDKEPVLLKMCALFINEENEDRTTITNDDIVRKIDDWKKEYEVNGFFTLALNMVNGYFEIYNKISQITSETK